MFHVKEVKNVLCERSKNVSREKNKKCFIMKNVITEKKKGINGKTNE